MRIRIASLAVLVAAAPLTATRADFPRLGIFRKKQKEDPPQRAKQLVESLKGDTDEKRRKSAAVELQNHDPRTNTDVVATLITAIQQDPSPDVRAAAAETIGKLKPVAQPAGVALEQALATDPSEAVRKAAQKALWDYHLNGYRSTGASAAYPQTPEPPLAKPRAATPPPVTLPKPTAVAGQPPRPITTGLGKGAVYPQTIEPPLAKPKPPRPVETVAPPTPSLSVPPLPKDDGAPPAAPPVPPVITPPPVKVEPKPAAPPIPAPAPPPGSGLPGIPAAPTVPSGPTVPTIPPPMK